MKEVPTPKWDMLWNVTFKFILDSFGKDSLIKYYKHLANSRYYEKVIKNIKEKGLIGVKEYWEKSSDDEGTDYTDSIQENEYNLKVDNCSAYKYFKKKGLKRSDMYCDYCKIINSELAKNGGLKYKLLSCDNKGKCQHLFYKGEE